MEIKGAYHIQNVDRCETNPVGSQGTLLYKTESWRIPWSTAVNSDTSDKDVLISEILKIPANSQILQITLLENTPDIQAPRILTLDLEARAYRSSGAGAGVAPSTAWSAIGVNQQLTASNPISVVRNYNIRAGTAAEPKWFFSSDEWNKEFRVRVTNGTTVAAIAAGAADSHKVDTLIHALIMYGNIG